MEYRSRMQHRTIEFKENKLYLLDQRKLPGEVEYYIAEDYREVKFAISDMVVRGAPAIGATAAYGVYLAAREFSKFDRDKFLFRLDEACQDLSTARPTAVNLIWALRRMQGLVDKNRDKSIEDIESSLFAEAEAIAREDVATNKQMAEYGNKVVPEGGNILTHCNTGALATVDYGTALGVIREAHYSGKDIHVYADETRPRLQGARLTAFELVEEGIPATLIVDSTAATLIRKGEIDVILTGADRIAANGDTANKIGTFMLSELALGYGIPFYIVAPFSTIDMEIESGEEIEIEEREGEEITRIGDKLIAPEGIEVYNPAFDITPAENITGIITEKGIARPPFKNELKRLSRK